MAPISDFPLNNQYTYTPVSSLLWLLNKESEEVFFTGLASIWWKYFPIFQQEEYLFTTLSIVCFQISDTFLSEFVNILLFVEANHEWICC